MKFKISKTEFEALSEELKKLYKADTGADTYTLQVEGYEDPAELRRARDRERDEGKTAKQRAAQLETELREARESTARTSGDIATLERSWKEKNETQKTEFEQKLSAKDKFIQKTLVDSVAIQVAAELAGDNADIILPHVRQRLTADLTADEPITRVIDANGKPSANSIEDLKKEFAANSKFSAIIVASKASGGAGGGTSSSGGAGKKPFNELTEAERVDWFRRDPAGFKAASDAAARKV